jgi:hypothetical protein
MPPPGPEGYRKKTTCDPGTSCKNESLPPRLPGGSDDMIPSGGVTQPACGPCSGHEVTTIAGLGPIKGYNGEFPAPLRLMWYVPEGNELLKISFGASEVRKWVRDAARYHGIPHVLLAVILQQENRPRASMLRKLAQFAERSLTTAAAIVDEVAFDIMPDAISGGSSGFANMSRATLRSAARYSERNYCKNPLPPDVRYRVLGWDQDIRIPGDDWKADLYYAAAHLRQLIDRITGKPCHNGPITLNQLERVMAAYNGTGRDAEKYGEDAIRTLLYASVGEQTLYFFEP